MATQVLDPGKHAVNIAGVLISGFEPGTYLEITRNTPLSTTKVSADGKEVARTQSRDKSGTLVLTLMATADANSFLDALRHAQETGTSSSFPFGMDDATNTEIFSTECWVQEVPSYSYAAGDAGSRQWTIGLANVDYIVTPQTTAWQTIKETAGSIIEDIF